MDRFLMALAITGIIYCLFLWLKCDNAHKNQMKILNAIDAYWWDSHNARECIRLLDNMEDYTSTLFRVWDFGCENILPKADYEIIKPYIEEKRNENSFR